MGRCVERRAEALGEAEQADPGEVAVALDELACVIDRPETVRPILCVAEGDEGVVDEEAQIPREEREREERGEEQGRCALVPFSLVMWSSSEPYESAGATGSRVVGNSKVVSREACYSSPAVHWSLCPLILSD